MFLIGVERLMKHSWLGGINCVVTYVDYYTGLIGLERLMKHSWLGGINYVVTYVDCYTDLKAETLVERISNTTSSFSPLIAEYIAPQGLQTKNIETDNVG